MERFMESGDIVDNLEATRINGSDDSATSFAMYRVSLAGGQPGVVSVDANVISGSGYFVGLSDYSSGHWNWQGPFSDNHIRLQAVTDQDGDLTSELGNTFITVLCPAGSSIDVVGIGVNQFQLADATPPAAPIGLTATPLPGGIELQWSAVLDPDLAGYAVYYSGRAFINPHSAGVKRLPSLEGSILAQLSGLEEQTYVAITAVDFSGNESPLTAVVNGMPLAGQSGTLLVSTDLVSGGINSVIQLTASGADSYDWDLDGDGVFEVQADSGGTQQADSSATGIIRPRVIGRDLSGEHVALGGLSLIITGNTRPVAAAYCDIASGKKPLTVNFTATAEDQEDEAADLSYAWDLQGDGVFDNNTDSLAIGPVFYTADGSFNVKFRVTDSDGAWDVDTITINVLDNQLPHASLQVEGGKRQPAPFLAHFDVSGCFDPDGGIAVYDWDWENDGVYDLTDGTAVDVTHLYPEIGEYEVRLRVRDADGGSDETVIRLVAQGWKTAAVNNGDDVGKECSLQVVDGYPAISYFDETNDALKYARSDTPTGEDTGDWQDIITVDATSGSGSIGTSLLVVDNTPAIAYYRGGGMNDLMYIRSSTTTGTQPGDWSAPVTVWSTGFTGQYPDMEIVNGNPAICFYDQSTPGLRYVRSNTTKGELAADWSTAINVDISGSVGLRPDMEIVDGNPAISYYDQDLDRLLYIRSDNKFGTFAADWTQKVILTGGGFTGYYSSLAVVGGKPAICYFDWSNKTLLYTSSSSADGALTNDWSLGFTIDTANSPGEYCSMIEFEGRPVIASYAQDNSSLHFTQASGSGSGPSEWEAGQTLEDSGIIGEYSSIAEVDGKVAIAYYQFSGGNLRYAIRYN
ncbi:PKD domain-containing protein [bacterium]|nr:PKD domain-containing protein [bacterium]